MVALVAWNRDWFTVRSTRRAVRRSALLAGLAPLLVGIAVVSAGAVLRNATVPDASPALLAWNFFVRLLPPSALSHLIPTLLPVTAIGHLIVEWAPLLVWAAWTVSVLLISTSGPRVDETPSAKAMEVKDFVREVGAGSLGWTTIRVAEEALIDLPGLAFTGKKFQDVRTALNRAAKEGIRTEWTSFPSAPEGIRDQVRAISTAWAGDKALPEMGFTLGSLAEIDDEDTRLLLAIDEDRTVHAVTSWLPVFEEGELIGLTLDVMRRRDNSFRPVIEFLIASAALAAKDEGLQILSLSGAPWPIRGSPPRIRSSIRRALSASRPSSIRSAASSSRSTDSVRSSSSRRSFSPASSPFTSPSPRSSTFRPCRWRSGRRTCPSSGPSTRRASRRGS